jgi:hypothetical protein
MTFSDLHIETTKQLAAQRQIDSAVSHLHKSELESAITLATAAESLLPETESRQIFAYLREHPLSKQVDIDKTINWLKRNARPDAATIFEFEAAVVIARAMSKFAAAYTEAPSEWYEFLSWGGRQGALADASVDEVMNKTGGQVEIVKTGGCPATKE